MPHRDTFVACRCGIRIGLDLLVLLADVSATATSPLLLWSVSGTLVYIASIVVGAIDTVGHVKIVTQEF